MITLLSIYPLLTIFIIEGEVHTIPAIVVAQLTFWLLVLLIISSYFLTKINIYFVTLLSILNITLNLILSFVFLKLNLTDLANPNQVYVYLLSIIGISILYVWCKLVHTKIWLPTIFAILLGIVEFLLL